MEIKINKKDMLDALAEEIIKEISLGKIDKENKTVELLRGDCHFGTRAIKIYSRVNLRETDMKKLKHSILGTIFQQMDGINDCIDSLDFVDQYFTNNDMTITEWREFWLEINEVYNDLLKMFTALEMELLMAYYRED